MYTIPITIPTLSLIKFDQRSGARWPNHITYPHLPPPSLDNNLSHFFSYLQSIKMPRSMAKQRRGGKSGNIRKRYTVLEKFQFLGECGRLQREANLTARSAAIEMGISHSLLVQWRGDANVENMRGSSKTKKSLHVGPDDAILPVQDELHGTGRWCRCSFCFC